MNSRVIRTLAAVTFAVFIGASAAVSQTNQSNSFSDSAPYAPRKDPGKPAKPAKKSSKDASEAPQVPPVPQADREMTIAAAAWGNDGRFVHDLKPDEFEVLVDDQPVDLLKVETSKEPVRIVLLVDVSPSAESADKLFRDRAIQFIQKVPATDQVMVVAFAEKARILGNFADSRDKGISALKKLGEEDGTSLYNTVGELFSKILTDSLSRTAIVLMTDAVDTTSRNYNYLSSLSAVEGSDAVVFPVYLDTSGYPHPTSNVPAGIITSLHFPDMKQEYERGRYYLTDMLHLSGGRPIRISDVKSDFAKMNPIPEEMRARYYLTFKVKQSGIFGVRHEIKVRVKRPGLSVLAKGSYLEK